MSGITFFLFVCILGWRYGGFDGVCVGSAVAFIVVFCSSALLAGYKEHRIRIAKEKAEAIEHFKAQEFQDLTKQLAALLRVQRAMLENFPNKSHRTIEALDARTAADWGDRDP